MDYRQGKVKTADRPPTVAQERDPPVQRVRRARDYMRRDDVRAWFAGVGPLRFPPRLALRLLLMKHRMALTMCALFTFVFDRV